MDELLIGFFQVKVLELFRDDYTDEEYNVL